MSSPEQNNSSPHLIMVDNQSAKKDSPVKQPGEAFLNVFGSPLAYATALTMYSDNVFLPKVLRDCIIKIEAEGLLEEGLYRKSGSNTSIERYKKAYNEYQDVNLDEADISTVTSLLKLYIRELPETMFTDTCLSQFEDILKEHNQLGSDAIDEEVKNDLIERVKEVFKNLPICNQTIIIWLSKHLNNVIEQHKTNKMDLINISIIFSPNLRTNRDILWFFIKFHQDLFGPTELTTPQSAYINPTMIEELIEEIGKEVELLIGDFKTAQPHKKSELMDKIYNRQQYFGVLLRKSVLINDLYSYNSKTNDPEAQASSKCLNVKGIDKFLRNRQEGNTVHLDGSKLRRYTSEITQTEIFLNTNSKYLQKYKNINSRLSQPDRPNPGDL